MGELARKTGALKKFKNSTIPGAFGYRFRIKINARIKKLGSPANCLEISAKGLKKISENEHESKVLVHIA